MRSKRILGALAVAALFLMSRASAQLPINLEIDYMEDATHSHRPSQLEIDALVAMFACRGYTLNAVVHEAVPHADVMQCGSPETEDFWSCVSPTSFRAYETTYRNLGTFGWHYCVFGHDYDVGNGTGSSGYAQIGGEKLIVTLGSFRMGTPDAGIGTTFDRAATLAHELGHNLGLTHSPPTSTSPTGPYAPNYASVMSYQYQLSGVRTQLQCLGLIDPPHLFKDLDYSSGRLATLAEPVLVEAWGAGIHQVDFDCSGTLSSVPVDVDLDEDSPWCGFGLGNSVLRDYDDWANLFDSSYFPAALLLPHDSIACITAQEQDALEQRRSANGLQDPSACAGPQPILRVESCPGGEMVFARAGTPGTGSGTGHSPFGDVSTAVGSAPDGSVLYLRPGTYSGGGPLMLDSPLTLAGPGVAVIDP